MSDNFRKKQYEQATPIPAKFLMPDGSVSDTLPGGGGSGGSTSWNQVYSKPFNTISTDDFKVESNQLKLKKEVYSKSEVNNEIKKIGHNVGNETWNIGGVIRNDGTGWKLISGAHKAENIDGISVNASGEIVIDYSTSCDGADNVVTFSTTPDEDMSSEGWLMGASVGVGQANITITKQVDTSVRVIFNGSTWEHSAGSGYDPIQSISQEGNIIIIKLNKGFKETPHISITPLFEDVSHFNLYGLRKSQGLDEIHIYCHNLDGTDVIDSSTRFWLGLSGRIVFNANDVVSPGNIWISGKMTRLSE